MAYAEQYGAPEWDTPGGDPSLGQLPDVDQMPDDWFVDPATGERDLLGWLLRKSDDFSWQERALCAQTDPEAFFPEKGGSTREAKRVCAACEVRAQCLEAALRNDERFGIWGGLSERERRRLKKRVV